MFVAAMKNVLLSYPKFFAITAISVNAAGSLLIITNVGQLGWVWRARAWRVHAPDHPLRARVLEISRTQELFFSLEHLTVVGGLLLAAILLAKSA
jgi:transmembrane protein